MSVHYDGAEFEITASTLFYIFKNEYSFRFENSRPEKYTGKNARLLRNLIDEQGDEKAVDIVKFAINNWADVQRACKLRSVPTIPIVYGFRATILEVMEMPKKNSVSYNNGKNKFGKNKRVNRNTLFIGK